MQRTRRTPEEKAEALRVFAAEGLRAAVRATGIPEGTIASWAYREGIQGPVVTERVAIIQEAAQVSYAQRRITLAAGIIADVERLRTQLFDKFETDALSQQRRAQAIATLVGVCQLLSGEATSRIEQANVEVVRAQALTVIDQLAARRAA